jgi:hypothetical protein
VCERDDERQPFYKPGGGGGAVALIKAGTQRPVVNCFFDVSRQQKVSFMQESYFQANCVDTWTAIPVLSSHFPDQLGNRKECGKEEEIRRSRMTRVT